MSMKKLKNVLLVGVIYFFCVIVTVWHIIKECLFSKDVFLYTFFQPNAWWITSLILTVVLFVMMHLCAKPLLFPKSAQQDEKNVKNQTIRWIGFVGSSFLFLVLGLFLAASMSLMCISRTTDLNNYLKFDPAVDQQRVLEMFPSKTEVDQYVEVGMDVSYEYSLKSGMFDSESIYSVVLDIKEIDIEEYQQKKTTLTEVYQGLCSSKNGKIQIMVEDNVENDLDGYAFSVSYYIELDDKSRSITYAVVKDYR